MPRALANIAQPGSLGNTKEYIESASVFQMSYINAHLSLVGDVLNKIMNINKLNDIKVLNPNYKLLLSTLSEMKGILTTNELRELLGYEDIEDINKDENINEEEVDVTISEIDITENKE